MKTAIFGGGFDPLHIGHEAIIQYLINQTDIDQLLLVPTGIPVHKSSLFFSKDARLGMLQAVTKDMSNVHIIDYELNKQGASYMVDTLLYIQKTFESDEYILVVGSDQLLEFHNWKAFEEILQSVVLWVINRGGVAYTRCTISLPKSLSNYHHKIVCHDFFPPNVSSSDIRRLLNNKQSIEDVISSEVFPFIV